MYLGPPLLSKAREGSKPKKGKWGRSSSHLGRERNMHFLHHMFSYGLEVIRDTKGNIEDYMIRSIIQDIVDVLSLMMILSGSQLLICFEICFFCLLSFFEKKKI